MFKSALLLLVASTTALTAGDTSCYEEPVVQSNQWYSDQVVPDIVLKSNIHAVVYTKTIETAEDLMIETQIFDAAGMMHEAIFDTDSMTVTVATKVIEEEDDTDPASGAKSVQSSALAWIAAAMVTMFSMSRAPSKISLTVLVVVALAVMTTAVESADDEVNCAIFGKESRVLIIITFPTTANNAARDQKTATVNVVGLTLDPIISQDSGLCDDCDSEGKECVFGLAGQLTCGKAKTASMIEDLVSFRWLDSSCRDTNDDKAKTNVNGIVIFSHGWQKGGGLRKSNPCWRSDWGSKPGRLTSGTEVTAWIKAGWKVGQVHWERLADEGEVKDAEAKIWRASNGRKNMRYKTGSGKNDYGYDSNTGGKDAATLLWPMVKNAIKDAANANVRVIFAGHSLGTQMITRLANSYTIDRDITTNRKIDLWLLDAFFSRGGEGYLGGGTNGNNVYNLVMNIKRRQGGNRVYRTRTSLANGFASGDNMNNLNERVMMTEMETNYFNQIQQGEKHNVAYVLFLRSISGFRSGQGTPSALNTADKSGQCWWQKEGGSSVATTDDQFGGGSGYKYRYNPPWYKPWYVGCKK